MDIHENARTTPHSRAEIVRRVLEEGWSRKAAAEAFGVCIKTVGKWIDRFLAEGLDGLKDRSSRPHRLRNPTPEAKAGDVIALRRQRLPGDEIARLCGLSVARNRQPHPPRCKTLPRARPRSASADQAL
jgi:transposase-like protein